MNKLDTKSLDALRAKLQDDSNYIKVGMSTCGLAAGSQEIYNTLIDEAKKRSINIKIVACGCLGMCAVEPLVEINVKGLPRVIYAKVDKDTAVKIIDKHATGERLVNDHVIFLTEQLV